MTTKKEEKITNFPKLLQKINVQIEVEADRLQALVMPHYIQARKVIGEAKISLSYDVDERCYKNGSQKLQEILVNNLYKCGSEGWFKSKDEKFSKELTKAFPAEVALDSKLKELLTDSRLKLTPLEKNFLLKFLTPADNKSQSIIELEAFLSQKLKGLVNEVTLASPTQQLAQRVYIWVAREHLKIKNESDKIKEIYQRNENAERKRRLGLVEQEKKALDNGLQKNIEEAARSQIVGQVQQVAGAAALELNKKLRQKTDYQTVVKEYKIFCEASDNERRYEANLSDFRRQIEAANDVISNIPNNIKEAVDSEDMLGRSSPRYTPKSKDTIEEEYSHVRQMQETLKEQAEQGILANKAKLDSMVSSKQLLESLKKEHADTFNGYLKWIELDQFSKKSGKIPIHSALDFYSQHEKFLGREDVGNLNLKAIHPEPKFPRWLSKKIGWADGSIVELNRLGSSAMFKPAPPPTLPPHPLLSEPSQQLPENPSGKFPR